LVEINHYYVKLPNYIDDASDWDYYGYTDMDFTVLDRKGYKAPWLERKMTSEDVIRIQEEAICYLREKSYVF